MRMLGWQNFLAAFLAVALSGAVSPAHAQNSDVCVKGQGDAKLAACSAVIASGRWRGRDLAWAYNNRGNAYRDKGAPDRAIADYNEAIRLDPRDALAYNNRGNAYGDKGDRDRALEDYNEAIRLDPKYAFAYRNRGDIYSDKGDRDRAIADYNEAIRLNPKYPSAYNGRGNAYLAKRDFDRAIADYSEAIRLDPKDAIFYRNRGRASRSMGDLGRAIADYSEAIRLDPQYADAYNSRGACYQDRGDLDRAIADYNEAIRLNPRSFWSYSNRGRAWLYSGSVSKALADLNQAADLDPKSGYAALWLDIVAQRSGVASRLQQAVSQVDMGSWPGPIIRFYLGQLTTDALGAAADNADPVTKKNQLCEANFYTGAFVLRQDAKPEAIRLFKLAAADCPRTYLEWSAAVAELKALGAEP